MGTSAKHVGDLHRLLGELVLLRSHEPWTPRSLGERFGVSEKTIRRDIKKLVATGFAVAFDRARGGYRLESDTFLPPVQLTLDEALALIVICEDVAGRGQVALLDAALGAMTKIESLLPTRLRRDLEDVMDHVEVRLARSGSSEGERGVFDTVREAILRQTVIKCQYRSAQATTQQRTFEFEPYALWYGVRAWYTIGRHRKRDRVVALKLRRFQRIDATTRRFVRPKDFSIDGYLGNAWQMIPGANEYNVVLRFDQEFAETVADTHWHRSQRIERHVDGSVTLRFRVAGLDEILWWVLSMGRHCEVVEPADLRDRVRQEASALVDKYPQPRRREGGR